MIRWLKADGRLHDVPVVTVAGDTFNRQREAAARAGCDVFLPKPCLPDMLTNVVAGLIRPARG